MKKNIATILDHSPNRNSIKIDTSLRNEFADCVKLVFNGSEAWVKKADLFSVMFLLANETEQARMIPFKREEVKPFARKHTVALKNDMKAGEILNVHCEVNVTQRVEEALKKEWEEKRLSPGLETPYLTDNSSKV